MKLKNTSINHADKVWIIFVLHSMSVCDGCKCNMLR